MKLILAISLILLFSCDNNTYKKDAAKRIRADFSRALGMYDCNNYSQVMKEFKSIESNHKNRWEMKCKNKKDRQDMGKCAKGSKIAIESNFESFRSKLYSQQDKCELKEKE